MAMKRLGLALYAGVMVFALAACAVPEKMSNAPKTPEPVALTASVLAGTEWTAFAIDGLAEVVSPKPKLRWDLSQRVSGTGGCNAFGAPSTVVEGNFRVGPLVPVGKMCLTLPGGQEDLFFKALELARQAHLEQDQLVLTDANAQSVMRLFKTK